MKKTNVRGIEILTLETSGDFKKFYDEILGLPKGSKVLLNLENPSVTLTDPQLVILVSLTSHMETVKNSKLGIVDPNVRIYANLQAMALENSVRVFPSMLSALLIF